MRLTAALKCHRSSWYLRHLSVTSFLLSYQFWPINSPIRLNKSTTPSQEWNQFKKIVCFFHRACSQPPLSTHVTLVFSFNLYLLVLIFLLICLLGDTIWVFCFVCRRNDSPAAQAQSRRHPRGCRRRPQPGAGRKTDFKFLVVLHQQWGRRLAKPQRHRLAWRLWLRKKCGRTYIGLVLDQDTHECAPKVVITMNDENQQYWYKCFVG